MKRFPVAFFFSCVFTMAAAMVSPAAKAQGVTYSANVGAETKDQGVQADGFFPNELWLLENDSITWTFVPKNEPHTVTLLTPNQVRPQAPPPAGRAIHGTGCSLRARRLFTTAAHAFPLPPVLTVAQHSR